MERPHFASEEELRLRLGDPGFWSLYVDEILCRHGLGGGAVCRPAATGTFPTFVHDDVVVKLFGHLPRARSSYEAERLALASLGRDGSITAPHLLGQGELFDEGRESWPYLIVSRVPGTAWEAAERGAEATLALAAQLGRQVARLHRLPSTDAVGRDHWPPFDLAKAAALGSLPGHLARQAAGYVARLDDDDMVFVHGDLTASHIFVEGDRLSGIIDWGDAMAADRHYELIQVFRDLFACDRVPFRIFLEASDWPVGKDFHQRAMAQALVRQAVGMTQHRFIDVFEPISERWPLHEFATLDELALELFGL